MRRHFPVSNWRFIIFESGFGEQLKRLNRNWVLKKHSKDEYIFEEELRIDN